MAIKYQDISTEEDPCKDVAFGWGVCDCPIYGAILIDYEGGIATIGCWKLFVGTEQFDYAGIGSTG